MILDLFAYADSRKERGMSLASDAEERDNPGFSELALRVIETLARKQPTVHIDDFLTATTLRPEHYNSMGSIWSRAIRSGLIRKSGLSRKCKTDPKKNSHEYPVYDSLVFERRGA